MVTNVFPQLFIAIVLGSSRGSSRGSSSSFKQIAQKLPFYEFGLDCFFEILIEFIISEILLKPTKLIISKPRLEPELFRLSDLGEIDLGIVQNNLS